MLQAFKLEALASGLVVPISCASNTCRILVSGVLPYLIVMAWLLINSIELLPACIGMLSPIAAD